MRDTENVNGFSYIQLSRPIDKNSMAHFASDAKTASGGLKFILMKLHTGSQQ